MWRWCAPFSPLAAFVLTARYLDFTYDPIKYQGLPEFVDKLHNELNMHVCPSRRLGGAGVVSVLAVHTMIVCC